MKAQATKSWTGAFVLAVAVLLPPGAAQAYKGFCSQPSTNGPSLAATDCLYVLKVAVGINTCTPECMCAPKGTLPTKASDALLCLRRSVGQRVLLLCPCAVADGDDFDDNSKDLQRWYATDSVDGHGVLAETGAALQYTCGSSTNYDQSVRPWAASVFPSASDWDIRIDLANSTVGTELNHVDSLGITVLDMDDYTNEFFGELYVSSAGHLPSRSGFYGELYTNDQSVSWVDTGGNGVTAGALRIAFDGDTKVVTLHYDANSANGYQWQQYGSFGLAGSGGASGNTNWSLDNASRFVVTVYGYSSNMVITSGQMKLDNFHATGGIMP